AEIHLWVQKLLSYMATEKPYLRPDLRLSDVATALSLRPYQLSEVLNRGENKNFFEFVNGYRIEEVKRRLLDPKFSHMNLLGIAIDSGFNSKSVFNDTFKRFTGTTPSLFRQSLQSS